MDPVFRKKLIQPWLTETLESQLTHADLHYVAFSLLFEECKGIYPILLFHLRY